ncbi:hypothetical protein ABW19_dt0209729 [Dactylella cylindrospora]|nr:hypothetical protein ABW19_dt0209729 [Dactylella cylindrospora]
MTTSLPHLVYGVFAFAPNPETGDVDHVVKELDLLEELGIKHVDTAQIYGQSEFALGKANPDHKFIVDTKFGGGFKKGSGTYENVIAHGTEASKTLGPIDVYYLHAPDPSIPLEPTLDAIQQLYKDGIFKRFGLSNYVAEDIQRVYDYMSSKGYVLPTVFQGNYNAFARAQETITFPTLRKLKIAFYAYSPLAGGLLAKTKEQMETAGGRWDASTPLGSMYRTMYGKEAILNALDEWDALAQQEGISRAELGYRWIRYHSALKGEEGDAVVYGAFGVDKIRETTGLLRAGPLSDTAVKGIDAIWEKVKDVAPHDNYNSFSRG